MKQQIISLLERAKENGTTIGDVLAEVRGFPDGWQSIETAPKDGAEIWGFNGEQARMLWSEGEHWALWVWADSSLADIDPSPDQPTHWMPIPAAPGADSPTSRPATPAASERTPVADERAAFEAWACVEYRNATQYTRRDYLMGLEAWQERGRRAALASAPVACDHQFHFFGDQKERRCNRCCVLESKASTPVAKPCPVEEQPDGTVTPVDPVDMASAPVAGEAQADDLNKKLFEAAILDLAAISEHLGLDPDEGGAEPIIGAIDELRCERDSRVNAQRAADGEAAPQASPAADGRDSVNVVAVLAYRSNGRRGAHGQTIGADGSGDFVVLYRGDEFAALVKANEEIRTLEAAGHRLSFAAIVHGEGYSGPVIRHEYVTRAAIAAQQGEGGGV